MNHHRCGRNTDEWFPPEGSRTLSSRLSFTAERWSREAVKVGLQRDEATVKFMPDRLTRGLPRHNINFKVEELWSCTLTASIRSNFIFIICEPIWLECLRIISWELVWGSWVFAVVLLTHIYKVCPPSYKDHKCKPSPINFHPERQLRFQVWICAGPS